MVPYSNAILNLNNGPFKSRPTWLLSWIPMLLFGFGMAGLVHSSMITIQWKYNSVLILRAGQLGALIKYTSRLERNNIVSYRMNLIRTSNKHRCKYNRVVLSSFGKTNQLTEPFKIGLSKCSDFECVWYSDARYSSPRCTKLFSYSERDCFSIFFSQAVISLTNTVKVWFFFATRGLWSLAWSCPCLSMMTSRSGSQTLSKESAIFTPTSFNVPRSFAR